MHNLNFLKQPIFYIGVFATMLKKLHMLLPLGLCLLRLRSTCQRRAFFQMRK